MRKSAYLYLGDQTVLYQSQTGNPMVHITHVDHGNQVVTSYGTYGTPCTSADVILNKSFKRVDAEAHYRQCISAGFKRTK